VVLDRDDRRFVHTSSSRAGAARRFPLARERGLPMSSLMIPSSLTHQEVAELKARRLACSYLVKGCQDAIFDFREKAAGMAGAEQARAAQRTIEILEDALGSWCETLSILYSALNPTSSQTAAGEQSLEAYPGVFMNESSRSMESLSNTEMT